MNTIVGGYFCAAFAAHAPDEEIISKTVTRATVISLRAWNFPRRTQVKIIKLFLLFHAGNDWQRGISGFFLRLGIKRPHIPHNSKHLILNKVS